MGNRPSKKWTLIFYFASDNPLAPNVIPQLKALKNAGFHLDVNVVLQFDPNIPGIPSHVFDVNNMYKVDRQFDIDKGTKTQRYQFWTANDPYIRNIILDKLWSDNEQETKLRCEVIDYVNKWFDNPPNVEALFPLPQPSVPSGNGNKRNATNGDGEEPAPVTSLGNLIDMCMEKYPAEHYMLFLLGHGLVVGNDMFLFDEHALKQYLTLQDLGKTLQKFKDKNLELVGFHSCGLSGLEVACELKDSAKYMIASQGSEFVGSWPYREILLRVFNDVKDCKLDTSDEIKIAVEKIFAYVLKSSYDFQMAGYSFDLSLCDIDAVSEVTSTLSTLSKLLTEAVQPQSVGTKKVLSFIHERILLAHWKSQSFWQESYTDLYDFCKCLKGFAVPVFELPAETKTLLENIGIACQDVIEALERQGRPSPFIGLPGPIVRAEFAGPEYQYSHGLSVYFPWTKPSNHEFWIDQYPNYRFNQEFASGWAEFLETYWQSTERDTIGTELDLPIVKSATAPTQTQAQEALEKSLLEHITGDFRYSNLFLGAKDDKPVGSSGMGNNDPKPVGSSGLGPKPNPTSGLDDPKPTGGAGTGANCNCGSVKNYPLRTFPTSPDFFKVLDLIL